ncbi:glycoside hydrolase family 43 protein [Botryosphaeria dothidea]|uniref:Glycoside hydrolase family 43 protein n=1 Tax=Botryosphaeria dothidea TaxID=55169 RepID=A0A8H4N4E6_9PEZI|nr:glycoside hydrolase family 43 protein [Botryosphaeria dothidea]
MTSLVTAGTIQRRAVNEVISSNFPDPSIVKVGTTWYSFATNSGGINVQIAKSLDFKSWTVISGKDALPNLPRWVNNTDPAVWAPDVIQNDDGEFVLYFSALSGSNHRHCLGVGTSKDIEGPYAAQDDPWVCPVDQGGAIDSSGFHDSDGSRYVTYKIDGNSLTSGQGSCGNVAQPFSPTPIMQQKIAGNGIDKLGEPYQILDRSDDDGPLVEAPSIAKLPDGRYVLFFSSGCFSADYHLKYALADSVNGPYTKYGILHGTENLKNPGGASIAEDGTHILFHADLPAGGRGMYAATVAFNGNDGSAN